MNIRIIIVGYTDNNLKTVGSAITNQYYFNQAFNHLINMSGITRLIHKEVYPIF